MLFISFTFQIDLHGFLHRHYSFRLCNDFFLVQNFKDSVFVVVMNNVTMADEEEETEADENICPPGKGTSLVLINLALLLNECYEMFK